MIYLKILCCLLLALTFIVCGQRKKIWQNAIAAVAAFLFMILAVMWANEYSENRWKEISPYQPWVDSELIK